jgi:hypothetical protein
MSINYEAVHASFPGATIKMDGTATKADGSLITAQEIENAVATYGGAIQAKQNISDLEAQITPRRLREAVLGIDNGWLANKDAEIAAVRGEL